MRSPFPGMDPYLEAPSGWAGVHSRLINAISDDLGDRLASAYIVTIEERVYIATPDDLMAVPAIVPDVFVITAGRQELPAAGGSPITPPVLIEPLIEEEVHDRYLEIRDTRSRAVITTIEILSPYNKAAGTRGREAFLRKRQAVLASQSHWIEIDLLRAGERPPEARGRGDYYALLCRGEAGARYAVWAWRLRERLPTIAVPLRAPDADAPLDLQAMLETVYRRGHYADALDYQAPVPPPPLAPGEANWAEEQLRAWRANRAPMG